MSLIVLLATKGVLEHLSFPFVESVLAKSKFFIVLTDTAPVTELEMKFPSIVKRCSAETSKTLNPALAARVFDENALTTEITQIVKIVGSYESMHIFTSSEMILEQAARMRTHFNAQG